MLTAVARLNSLQQLVILIEDVVKPTVLHLSHVIVCGLENMMQLLLLDFFYDFLFFMALCILLGRRCLYLHLRCLLNLLIQRFFCLLEAFSVMLTLLDTRMENNILNSLLALLAFLFLEQRSHHDFNISVR